MQMSRLRGRPSLLQIIFFAVVIMAAASVSNHVTPVFSSLVTGPAIVNHKPPAFLRTTYHTRTSREGEVDEQHQLNVPFYNVSGDWSSSLTLTNQAPEKMYAVVTLFN